MHNEAVVLLFMFVGLTLGIVVTQLIAVYGESVPYTVVIFLLGGILACSATGALGAWSDSIIDWVNIDADVMLFVFLPPLIFGEAMNLNWHHVRGALIQSLILAGPGVVIGALVMGAITKALLPYDWSWELCFLFGSILSATDPVAVVALLKSANASPKLTILIVGESLLNDGTAMVMFTLFYNMLSGDHYNFGSVTAFFVEAAIGSVVLGFVFGFATLIWLRSASRPLKESDIFIQISITICCAYLVFFAAQYGLEISGVLACCGAGVVLCIYAAPIIVSHESMHSVWAMIEWIGNTLIFILAGLIIGRRTLQHVQAMDWFYCILLYLFLMGLRVVIILILYPFLSTIGHKCNVKEAIFMSWAGLRGALGMALALLVKNSKTLNISDSEASRLFFYVGGIAALTLIINATFAKNMLNWLGLLDTNSVQKTLVIRKIKGKLRNKINQMIEDLSPQLGAQAIEEVRQSCSLLREDDVDAEQVKVELDRLSRVSYYSSNTINGSFNQQRSWWGWCMGEAPPIVVKKRRNSISRSKSVAEVKGLVSKSLNSVNQRSNNSGLIKALILYFRKIFLEIVRVKYWHLIESGTLPRLSHSAQYLLYTVDVGLDTSDSIDGFHDWTCVEAEISNKAWYHRLLHSVGQYSPAWLTWIHYFIAKFDARKEKRSVYLLTAFITAHEHAQKKIHSFVDEMEEDEETTESAITPEEKFILAQSEQVVQKAKHLLNSMSPSTVHQIQVKQTARAVLAKEAELVKVMLQEGLLTPTDAEELLEEIGVDTAEIERSRNSMYATDRTLFAKKHEEDQRDNRNIAEEEGSSLTHRRPQDTSSSNLISLGHESADLYKSLLEE